MLWFVVLLFPLLSLAKHRSSKELTSAESVDDVTKPVNVSVYYQTLCPASQYLIQYPVWNLYNDLYKVIIVILSVISALLTSMNMGVRLRREAEGSKIFEPKFPTFSKFSKLTLVSYKEKRV